MRTPKRDLEEIKELKMKTDNKPEICWSLLQDIALLILGTNVILILSVALIRGVVEFELTVVYIAVLAVSAFYIYNRVNKIAYGYKPKLQKEKTANKENCTPEIV